MPEDGSDDFSKALITLGVLCCVLVLALIVAKILDYCYDRATLRDDSSDISEHTRKLIRARLTVMKFTNRGEKRKSSMNDAQRATRVIRIWSAKSKRGKQQALENNTDTVIQVEESGLKNDASSPKLAFLDVPFTIPNTKFKLSKNNSNELQTLKVPRETKLMVLESAEFNENNSNTLKSKLVATDNQNKSQKNILSIETSDKNNLIVTEGLPNVPESHKSQQNNVKLKLVASNNQLNSPTNVTPIETIDETIPKNHSTKSSKTVPRNQTKSLSPVETPTNFSPPAPTHPPLNKSKSVPYINTRASSVVSMIPAKSMLGVNTKPITKPTRVLSSTPPRAIGSPTRVLSSTPRSPTRSKSRNQDSQSSAPTARSAPPKIEFRTKIENHSKNVRNFRNQPKRSNPTISSVDTTHA